MENDIIDSLEDIGYTGPMNDEGILEKALDGGPKSIEYTGLVEWLSKELKILCKLDEHINAIASAEDSSSFMLELSSFLKELGCGYSCLMEGHVSDRLNSREQRILLLDFLVSELQAARMISVNKPDTSKLMEVQLSESSTATDLKNMLIALKFPRPPTNITSALLFRKVEQKMKEELGKASPALVGTPLFTGVLSDKQWNHLGNLQQELQDEYQMRRQMLVKRMDVTIQSFQWSERVRNQEDQIVALYMPRRKEMLKHPSVDLADLLAARGDLAVIEKTSSASVRKNTQSSINKVIIGRVPDRGGRPSEQQPPPPEMPSWQQQKPGGFGGGGRGGYQGGRGGGGGGGGGDRGGRVHGGWNQGGRGGYSGGGHHGGAGGHYRGAGGHHGGTGGHQGAAGGHHGGAGGHHGGGGGYQGGGSYQNRAGNFQGASYQDHGASGYHGRGGSHQDRGGAYQDRGGSGYHERGYHDRGGRGRGGRGGRGRDRDNYH